MMRHAFVRSRRLTRSFVNQAQQSAGQSTNQSSGSSSKSDVVSVLMYTALFGGAFYLANSLYHPRIQSWFGNNPPADLSKRSLKLTDRGLAQSDIDARERATNKQSESNDQPSDLAATDKPAEHHHHNKSNDHSISQSIAAAPALSAPTDIPATSDVPSTTAEKQAIVDTSVEKSSLSVPVAVVPDVTTVTGADIVPVVEAPKPDPSSQSSASAPVTPAQSSSSDDDLGEPSDAERAHLEAYFSAPADEHPNKPGLRLLTANRIDSVLASPTPFILYVHDPECGACSLYEPVVESLAAILNDVAPDAVRVYQMNDSTDYKPGFLAADESNLRLPLIKFYPQSESKEPEVYTDAPHVEQIVAFLNTRAVPVDAAQVKSKLDDRLVDLRAQLKERGVARLSQSNDWALFKASPCGDEISNFTLTELMSNFAPGVDSNDAYESFTKCVKDREDAVIEYFTEVARIASETAAALQMKRDHSKHGFTPEEEAEIVSAAASASS